MNLSALLLASMLAACSTTTYTHGTTSVSRTSFGTTLDLGVVDITDETGSAHIEAAKSDQVEGLKAVAEGVAKGLAAGAKP